MRVNPYLNIPKKYKKRYVINQKRKKRMKNNLNEVKHTLFKREQNW